MTAAGPRAVDIRVTGQVQGVYFRVECEARAERLGVVGWVSNEPDGSVRGHFEGTSEAVDALVAWCHEGSARSVVDEVQVSDVPATGADRFERR